MSWAEAADRTLAPLFAELPRDTPDGEVRAKLRDAYPFGMREYWPYKVWLKRCAAWRRAWRMGRAMPAADRRSTRRRDGGTVDLFDSEEG